MQWATITFPRNADSDSRLGELKLLHGKDLFIARSINDHGLSGWQPATTATLLAAWECAPSAAFFDVGANIGIYAMLHAQLWEDAATVAFEPTPEVAESGASITEKNGLQAQWERVAVSDTEGEATLYLSAKTDASNSLKRSHRRAKGTVTVPTVTLDGYVRSSGLVPSVVKIDVERHEPAVIRGAAELLEDHKPIVVAELLPGRSESDHVQRLLASHGYQAQHISPPPEAPPSDDALRDWLFWPGTLPAEFDKRCHEWYWAVARCVPVPG
jgi:FkbM family methyltransferase